VQVRPDNARIDDVPGLQIELLTHVLDLQDPCCGFFRIKLLTYLF